MRPNTQHHVQRRSGHQGESPRRVKKRHTLPCRERMRPHPQVCSRARIATHIRPLRRRSLHQQFQSPVTTCRNSRHRESWHRAPLQLQVSWWLLHRQQVSWRPLQRPQPPVPSPRGQRRRSRASRQSGLRDARRSRRRVRARHGCVSSSIDARPAVLPTLTALRATAATVAAPARLLPARTRHRCRRSRRRWRWRGSSSQRRFSKPCGYRSRGQAARQQASAA